MKTAIARDRAGNRRDEDVTNGSVASAHRGAARRRSRAVWVGTTRIGGDGPVAIEARIAEGAEGAIGLAAKLESAGADLACVACPDLDGVRRLAELAPALTLPAVADIGRCDPALAIAAAEAGARALWFRPPADDDALLAEMAGVATQFSCALGLVIDEEAPIDPNAASLDQALARFAVVQAGRLQACGFPDFIVALRMRDPALMAATARAIARAGDFPLALSVGRSQAGGRQAADAASAMAMGLPLLMGVGDLICLSAGPDPAGDVHVTVAALRALGLRPKGVSVSPEPAFLSQRADATKIATLLEERTSHIARTIDVRLAGRGSASETALNAHLVVPPGAAADSNAAYGMRISGPLERERAADAVVDELAGLVEETAGAIDARDLEGLVADIARRAGVFRDTPSDTALLWARLGVALRHAFRGTTARFVWGHPEGAALYARLTGKRDPWQVPQPAGAPAHAEPDAAAAAISIAMGLAAADRAAGITSNVVAILDKASFDAGTAYEAMRAAGAKDANVTIVLVDPEGGDEGLPAGIGSQLSGIISSRPFLALREIGSRIARQLPGPSYTLIKRMEEFGRGLATGGTLFEELGLYYVGPVAGRSLGTLLPVLGNLRRTRIKSSVLLHVVGAMRARVRRPGDGETPPAALGWLADAARADAKMALVVAGDVPGTADLARRLPGRFHRVGGTARHGLGLAWGFAAGGLHPYLLLDRRGFWRSAGEQAREIVRLRLPICFVVDLMKGHAPEPWLDAPPVMLEAVPGFVVMLAADAGECARMLAFARGVGGQPVIVGHAGATPAFPDAPDAPVELGRGRMLASGSDISILAIGRGVAQAAQARAALAEKGISASVADARFAQPLDGELAVALFAAHRGLVVLDDPSMAGGIAAGIVDALSKAGVPDFRRRLRVVPVGRGSVRDALAAAADIPAA